MSGRSAVVTGASKGIGRGIAIALARDGWDVVVNFSTNEGAAKAPDDITKAKVKIVPGRPWPSP